MPFDAAHWQKFNDQIIQSIDIILEYQSFGVKLTKTTPSASGTIPCYGFLRSSDNPDKNASAYISVTTGRYCDKPNGDSLTFWDFCVAIGKFPTWEDARNHYASKAGMGKKLPKKQQFGERPNDKVSPYKHGKQHHFAHFLSRYHGITTQGIALSGGSIGKYPLKSDNPRFVIYWYAYGPQLLNSDPTAVAVMPLDGGKLSIYQGENAPPRQEPKAVFCGTGLIGLQAFKHWDEAEVIYKVEGLTDLCALQSIIPPDKRSTHLVLTNACGANETDIVHQCRNLFKNKKVVVIGDADQAGQNGASIWMQQIGPVAESISNIQLPYELQPKKGKDLRDFIIQTGGSWIEFQNLCGQFEPAEQEQIAKLKSADQLLLENIGIEVIGETEGRYTSKVYIFSQELGKRSEINQVSKLTRADLIQQVGPQIRDYVLRTSDDAGDGKVHLWQVKEAIAAVASMTPLSIDQVIGPGCWEIDGTIYLIGNRDVATWDGNNLEVSRIHSVKGKLIEHSQEPWYSYKQLNQFLKDSASQEWCISSVEEANNLFRLWTNWKHYRNAEITTALVACSWLQTVWKWRPVVAVTGPSNCGKSTLVVDCLPHIFGDLSLDFESTPTEAGIRNLLRCSAKVLILDEFENTKQKGGQKRRDSIVQDIFRTTTRGGRTARGTADQKGMTFGLRHIPWTAAISIKMDDAADRSRYVILEMNGQSEGESSSLILPASDDLHRLGIRLLAVVLRHWKRIVELHAWLKQQPIEGYYQRIVESYGLIAGFFGAVHGLSNEESLMVLMDYLKHRDFSDQSEYQHQQFLRDIVTQEVFLPRGDRRLVGELLKGSVDLPDADAAKILERVGVRRLKGPQGPELFLSHELIAKNLLRGDFRGSEVRQVLKHCKDAEESKQRIGGHNARGFVIRENRFWEMIGGSDESNGQQAGAPHSNGSAGNGSIF